MKVRKYSAPLTVLAAGTLGLSLICIVSVAALINPGTTTVSAIEPQDIVDSAFSDPISTAVALTAVEISEIISTPTSTDAQAVIFTNIPSSTPTAGVFSQWTRPPPTRTREGRSIATSTSVASATALQTLTPKPTNTSLPTSTFTHKPTSTPLPTLTLTPRPPDTQTPVTPTDTPPPTETPPPPTSTDTPDLPPEPSPTPEPSQTPTPG